MVEMFFPGLWWVKYAVGAVAGAIMAGLILISFNALLWRPAAVNEGREIERADQLKKSIELIQKRGRTNAEINALSDASLCTALGGIWVRDHCE